MKTGLASRDINKIEWNIIDSNDSSNLEEMSKNDGRLRPQRGRVESEQVSVQTVTTQAEIAEEVKKLKAIEKKCIKNAMKQAKDESPCPKVSDTKMRPPRSDKLKMLRRKRTGVIHDSIRQIMKNYCKQVLILNGVSV